jgi:hypothetical protein
MLFRNPSFRRLTLIMPGLIALSAWTAPADSQVSAPPDNSAAMLQVAQNYGKIPLSFEANQGQADKTVKFVSRGSGYSLFLTDASAVLALTKPEVPSARPGQSTGKSLRPTSARPARKADVVRMDLAGASRTAHPTGSDALPGTANYFIGNDQANWHAGVPTYAKVKYTGVYPGIDLVYYGDQRQLEYDFVVAPGADPRPIRLQFAGAKGLRLDADGDLTVTAAHGEIAFHKPVIYQVRDGVRQPVDGQFALLAKNAIGFTLGQYDHLKPLVIDPVLSYSTYLGGSLADGAYGIVADSSGNAYVVGSTFSANFPVTNGAYQSTNKEPANFQCVFVTKLNPTGTALVYSTYLGGSGATHDAETQYGDVGQAIAVDGAGDAYVTGLTQSTSFPITAGAFQTVNNSTLPGEIFNAFVTKLNPTGTALVYSTYLGGTSEDYASAIVVDSLDNAYVTGRATSGNFPTTAGAFQLVNHASSSFFNTFVTKLNPTGTALVYSTYLGGSGIGAQGAGIAVDSSGDAYVTGSAASTDFPITNGAFQTVNPAAAAAGPDNGGSNAFVTKLNPTGTALLYSTFLGGSTGDYGAAIALDNSGDAYVTGEAGSQDFPVTGSAYQSTNNAFANDAVNAFVTEVNPAGTGLLYSTFLGGSGIPPQACGSDCTESGSGDSGNAIAVDGLGDAYVTGDAISSNFPTTSGAYQTVNNAAGYPATKTFIGSNAFITKLNPGGSQLLYSTYLGGSSQDYGYAIALDGVGGVYVAGQTSSTNFPTTTGAFQTANAGGDSDAFIAKLAIGSVVSTIATTTSVSSSANPQVQGNAVTFTVTVTPASGTGIPTGNVVFSVDGTQASAAALGSNGKATYSTSSLTTGQHTIRAGYAGSTAYAASNGSITETITAPQAATPAISPAAGTYTSTQSVTITDSTTGAAIYYTTNGTTPTASSTHYTGAISVAATETIEAIAVATGYTNSAVASATYTINLGAAATPVFSPTGGTYTSTQSVTITDSTAGADVYYTTDGTTPTASSLLYSGPFPVSATETVEAIAVAAGLSNSAVASADYIIVAAAPGYTLNANPSSLTIQSGSSASTVITLTPTGGFTGTVNLSCGTLPSKVTCTFSPAALAVASSSTPVTTTLTIGTSGSTTALINAGSSGAVLATIFALALALPMGLARRIRGIGTGGRPWLRRLLLLTAASLGAAGIVGCGSGSALSSPYTPPGTYSIPITVTSGGTTAALSLSIVVQ